MFIMLSFQIDNKQTQQKLTAGLLKFPHPQDTAGHVPLRWTFTDFKDLYVWKNQAEAGREAEIWPWRVGGRVGDTFKFPMKILNSLNKAIAW